MILFPPLVSTLEQYTGLSRTNYTWSNRLAVSDVFDTTRGEDLSFLLCPSRRHAAVFPRRSVPMDGLTGYRVVGMLLAADETHPRLPTDLLIFNRDAVCG